MSLECKDSSMVALDLESRVFTTTGKQHDVLKKYIMDKTLTNTLEEGMNTKLSTCDDKGVLHR
jgi:hypothetical protein